MELEGGDDFVEVAEDFGFVGVLDAGVGVGVGGGDDLEVEFVASSGGEGGVVAVEKCGASGGGGCLTPMKDEALSGCCAGGVGGVDGSGEGLAGFERERRMDDEMESGAAKGGIGIGVRRNGDGGDEDGARLLLGEFALSEQNGRAIGIGLVVE